MAAHTPEGILLTGRVAVVTAASGGVGRAVAELFASFGAQLALCDRNKPDGPLAMTMDVADPVAVEVFAEAVAQRYGRVDVLVNIGDRALIDEHLTGLTGLTRRLLPLMDRGSSIVNVTSGEAGRTAVTAAMKAAVESLTRSLAVELAPRGIRVNAVAPGDPVRPTPLGHPGGPSDVAAAVVFLAGRMARSVTGVTLHVDGGLHAHQLWCSGLPSL